MAAPNAHTDYGHDMDGLLEFLQSSSPPTQLQMEQSHEQVQQHQQHVQQQQQQPVDVGEASIHVDHDHVFRHAKELKNATHGRYLEGYVNPPPGLAHNNHMGYVLQLSAVPSRESRQPMQPNLLHVTIMNGSERKAAWKSTPTDADWRIRLRIRNSKASLLLPSGEEKSIDCVSPDGRVKLGTGGLLLTIITPLQDDKRGGPDGVRIIDVVKRRMAEEPVGSYEMGESAARQITQQFISKKANPEAKIEMHRCRIRAEFFSMDTQQQQKLAAPALSGDVCNSRHNDVGALELHEMSDPRASCTRGGFKVLLSSEFKAPTLKKGASGAGGSGYPIHAVFVVVRNGETMHAERAYPEFNQISLAKDSFQIHHNTLAFLVPAQSAHVIRTMREAGDAASVALFRPHDGKYSQSRFEFRYVEHPEIGVCHFCEVLRPTELRKYVRARKDHRRRVTEAGGGGGGSGSGGGSGGPSAGASPSSSSGGGGNNNSGGGSTNFRYNMSYEPYSPAYDSSTSGVYSPESSSNSQYGGCGGVAADDPYLGSPDPKRPCVAPPATTAIAADMESCSSSCSNGETTTVASVQVSPPLLPAIHVQPPSQLLDNWVQQVTSEAFMHSPNSELPIPEVMDASELSILGDKSSTSPSACPAYIPSPTHSPMLGQSATTNLMQSQALPEDLASVDLLADLLRSDSASADVTTDSPYQHDFSYLVPPPKEEVSRMRRRRGENFSGSSDEGIDILDGEMKPLVTAAKEGSSSREPDLTSHLVDQRQKELSDKFESLELETKTECSAPAASVIKGSPEVAETRGEDSSVWLKVLLVALFGVFMYEVMRLFVPVYQ